MKIEDINKELSKQELACSNDFEKSILSYAKKMLRTIPNDLDIRRYQCEELFKRSKLKERVSNAAYYKIYNIIRKYDLKRD